MLTQIRRSLVLCLIFFGICGVLYPLVETGLAQSIFSSEANGSLGPNGSALIGQVWSGRAWFHGRPDSDNPLASGATNLGPTSKALRTAVEKQIAELHKLGIAPTNDLVTTSGSGLDPDISPNSAYVQVPMVSKARHLPQSLVRSLVTQTITGPQLGVLGASYVNVLTLNEKLAALSNKAGGQRG